MLLMVIVCLTHKISDRLALRSAGVPPIVADEMERRALAFVAAAPCGRLSMNSSAVSQLSSYASTL